MKNLHWVIKQLRADCDSSNKASLQLSSHFYRLCSLGWWSAPLSGGTYRTNTAGRQWVLFFFTLSSLFTVHKQLWSYIFCLRVNCHVKLFCTHLSHGHWFTQGLKLSVLWTMFYGLMSAFAPIYGWILFLRALVGFGIGGAPQSWVSVINWWTDTSLFTIRF